MKNETKPNWFVPKIHERAKKQEEVSSQRALHLDSIPPDLGEVRNKFQTRVCISRACSSLEQL